MKKSPFYYLNLKNGAVMGGGNPWHTPLQFTDVLEEYWAVRKTCGLTDWSTMCKFDIKGPEAKAFMQYLLVNDVDRLAPGKGFYSSICNEQGGMFDDTTVYQLGENHYLLVGSTAGRAKDTKLLAELTAGREVYVTDVTGGLGILSVQGPNSRALLNSISDTSLDDIEYFTFKTVKIADHDVMVSRTGFTGELGFELFVASEDCSCVYEAVTEAGKNYGLKLVGVSAAAGALRLEKGYLAGKEYNESINPFEASVGWTVRFTRDFIGRKALEEIKMNGPARKLMGFIAADKTLVADAGKPVCVGDAVVGETTSTAYSPVLDKSIGLAFIDAKHAVDGAEVTVSVGDKTVAATLCGKAMYDPEGARLKA